MDSDKPEMSSISVSQMTGAMTPAGTPASTLRKIHISPSSYVTSDTIERYEQIQRIVTLQVKALKVIFLWFFVIIVGLRLKGD